MWGLHIYVKRNLLRIHLRRQFQQQTMFSYNLDNLWVHTRDPNPTSETIEIALDVVKRNALDETKLRMTNRRNC